LAIIPRSLQKSMFKVTVLKYEKKDYVQAKKMIDLIWLSLQPKLK
jgi:hypothetical protein